MNKGFGPMLEMARIQSEINRIFDNLLSIDSAGKESGSWIPMVDIHETDDTLVVLVELSGVAPGNVTITTLGGDIILRGEKPRPPSEGPARHLIAERAFGRFRRVIHLGVPVNTHKAQAVLSDGTLRLTFPKVPNRRGGEVAIEVAGA